jgi:hypothetical protein
MRLFLKLHRNFNEADYWTIEFKACGKQYAAGKKKK